YCAGRPVAAETDKASTTQKAWPACQTMLLLRPGGAKRASDSVTPLRTRKVFPRISLASNNKESSGISRPLFHRWDVAGGGGDFAGLHSLVFFLDPGNRRGVALHPERDRCSQALLVE